MWFWLIEMDLRLSSDNILAEDKDTIVTTKQNGRAWNRSAIHH
jgi:hypothetical protein